MKRIFEDVEKQLSSQGFKIVTKDMKRPWGGYFVIDESQSQKFLDTYFKGKTEKITGLSKKLSPKILVVLPNKRLSWQYHDRRAEIWKVIKGEVGIMKSPSDEPGPLFVYEKGHQETLNQSERHRLVGLKVPGVVAEIWIHSDTENPSNEEDIVRIQDDFGR